MKLEKVKFFPEITTEGTEPLPSEDNVHSVFADLIKIAKERIGYKVRVDISENDTREKVGGSILSPEKANFTTIELKLTVKVPYNENN
jgi:hypothetical protein